VWKRRRVWLTTTQYIYNMRKTIAFLQSPIATVAPILWCKFSSRGTPICHTLSDCAAQVMFLTQSLLNVMWEQVRRRYNRPVLDEEPRSYTELHSEQVSTCFIPNKLRSHFITSSFTTRTLHVDRSSTFGSVHLIFGFPRGSVHLIFGFPRVYRVCFVSVLGSSPPSLPVYVEEHTSFMGIYLIRMVRSVETKRMRGTKEKIRSAGNNLDTNC